MFWGNVSMKVSSSTFPEFLLLSLFPLPRSLGEDSFPTTSAAPSQPGGPIPSHSCLIHPGAAGLFPAAPTHTSHSLQRLNPPKILLSAGCRPSREGRTHGCPVCSSSAKVWRGRGSKRRQECGIIEEQTHPREGRDVLEGWESIPERGKVLLARDAQWVPGMRRAGPCPGSPWHRG